MKRITSYILAASLTFLISCGGGSFATTLRAVLAASGPLVESLPVSSSVKSGLITDFTDLAGDTADLATCLKAGQTKPADLVCVEAYDKQVEAVIARGHFKAANSPKVQNVLTILRGIITSAKIFYGERQPAVRGRVVRPTVTESDIKAQIEDLKAAMQP